MRPGSTTDPSLHSAGADDHAAAPRRQPSLTGTVSPPGALFAALPSDVVARGAVVGAVLDRVGVPLAEARQEFARLGSAAPDV